MREHQIQSQHIGLKARDKVERRVSIYIDRLILGDATATAEGVVLEIFKQRSITSKPEITCTVLDPIEALDIATRLQAVALQYLAQKGTV